MTKHHHHVPYNIAGKQSEPFINKFTVIAVHDTTSSQNSPRDLYLAEEIAPKEQTV